GTFYDKAIVEKFIELIPELRSTDETQTDGREVQASVVAGLTRINTPNLRVDDNDSACLTMTVSAAVERLIDQQVGRIAAADACLFAVNAAQDALTVAHATPRI